MDSNGDITVVNGSKVVVIFTVEDPDKVSNKADKIQLLRVEDDTIVSSVARGNKKAGTVSLVVKKSEDEALYVRYIRKGKELEVIASVSHPGDMDDTPLLSIPRLNTDELTRRLHTLENVEDEPSMTYAIGDVGPAGGWVFYVTEDGLHGLEAAPTDQSPSAIWGCVGDEIGGAQGSSAGAGMANTADILQGCETAGIAADVAADYISPSGYFDWYLPSEAELDAIYQNIGPGSVDFVNIGNFVGGVYWSSTEVSAGSGRFISFSSGDHGSLTKNDARNVRAARAF